MNIKTNVFKRCEIVLNSEKEYGNPFLDVDVDAVFVHENGRKITLPGFWNGGNEWKVRFSPDVEGVWTYSVTCSDADNASLCDSCEIFAEACAPKTDLEKHGYVTVPENGRYFTYADGTPFFWLGDTHWQMADYERLHECNYPGCNCGNQFKHLVDDRAKKGFTVYQTYFDSAESDGGGNAHVHHWWSEYYTKINPEAFNETMDVMIEYLAEKGITVAMGFGVHSNTLARMKNDGRAIRAFAKYCVARYACYPIVWITAQEITVDPPLFETWRTVGATVGKYDGYHRPNSAHMYPMGAQDERAKLLDDSDWHEYWTLQAGHGGLTRIQPRSFYKSYYENAKVKPYIEAECHYEDIYCGGFCGYDASRVGAYQAIISGAAGFTYGVTGVWAIGWNQTDQPGWLVYSPEPWFVGMDKPGSTEMTYMRKFFEYIGWGKLEPDFGYDSGAFEMRKKVSIAHIGEDIAIYYFFEFDRETGMAAGLKPNVKYQMRWFDPINGKFIDLPDVTTPDGKLVLPNKPSARDWLLLLNTYDLGEYETEEYPEFIQPMARASVNPGEEIKIESVWASSENAEHPASNLIDGKDDTFWCGFAPCTSQTLIVDLGKTESVGYLQILSKMPQFYHKRFRIYGSNDKENWKMLSERAHDCVAIGGEYGDYFDPISGDFRYLKLFINSCAANTPVFEITKLGVYKK